MTQLQIIEVLLVHCNIVDNQIQRDLSVFFTFVLHISSTNHIYSETFHSEFSRIEVGFTDQSSVPLENDRISLTFVINNKSM